MKQLNTVCSFAKRTVALLLLTVFCYVTGNAQTAVPMSSQPGMTYTENFADISNWGTTAFASAGVGSNRWGAVAVNATGTVGDGVKISTATTNFSTGSSGGVQKGTGNVYLLSTSTANSCAIEFWADFTGVNAGTISFDVATVFNSTGNRDSKLKLFYSTNGGTSYTEITGTNLPYTAENNVAGSASISVALPAALNNNNVRFRFYEYSTALSSGSPSGSQPKISLDNVTVTATSPVPVVNTPTATSVTTTSAILGATVASGSPLTSRGTLWDVTTTPIANGLAEGGTAVSTFSHTRTGFTPNTLYYYRGYAVNSNGTGYSPTATFTTLHNAPTIATATNITSSSFRANWTAPTGGGSEAFTYTVQYSTTSDFSSDFTSFTDVSTLFKDIAGLNPGVDYYYRVEAHNAGGNSAWSATETLTTINTGVPVLSTPEVNTVTATSAILGATITSDGNDPITSRGTVYGTSASPTGNALADGGTATGAYTHTRTGLTPNTLYHFAGFAVNSIGTGYSSDGIFTTLPDAPASSAASAVTYGGFTANWSAPAGGSEAYTYTFEFATNNTFTTGDTVFNNLTSATTSFAYYINLAPATTYYYRVKAVNSTGSGVWSATQSVTTLAAPPTIAAWDFAGLTAYGTSPQAATTTASNTTVLGLTRGSGLTTNGTAASNAWGSDGYDVVSTAAAAITNNDYVTFSVTTSSSYSVSFSGVSSYNIRHLASGPLTGQWQYKIGAGSYTDIGSPITWGSNFTATGNSQPSIDLTGISALQNVAPATNVTFRIVNYGSSAITGTWYFNSVAVTGNDLVITGNVTQVTPIVTTTAASSITTTTAAAGGNVTSDGGFAVTNRGTVWDVNTAPTTALSTKTSDGTGMGSFSSSITGLTANTKYYYRAFATNSIGTSYGSELTLTALHNAPTSAAASAVDNSGFTANWSAPTGGGSEAYTYTLQYSTTSDFSSGNTSVTGISSASTSSAVSGLLSSTQYWYRVLANNAGGDGAWSATQTLTTTNSLAAPALSTPTATSITTTTAVLGANITGDGGAAITARGTVYSITSSPVANALDEGGTATGVYTQSRSGFAANTKYFYRGYAVNSQGTGYSPDGNFTTLPNAPTSSAASAVLYNSFTANWTAPAGGSETYTYTLQYSTTNDFSSGNTSVTAIPSGTLSKVVSGLSATTTYYYRVLATNVTGAGAWSATQNVTTPVAPTTLLGWDMSPLTGGTNNFGASPLAPTTSISGITVGSLTRGAGVNTTGTAAARGWGGLAWNNSTPALAVTANSYFTYTIKANAGFTLSLAAISPFSYRASGTGPTNVAVQYSTNGTSFTTINTLPVTVTTSGGGSFSSVDLTSISALQDLTSSTTVTFRFVPYGASGATGTFYVYDFGVSTASDFGLTGAVTCITPTTPTVTTPVTVCSGTSAVFTGAGGNASTYTFWTASTGGSQVTSGTTPAGTVSSNALTTPNNQAAGTYTYYVQGENGSCISAARQAVSVTVNAASVASTSATATATTICNGLSTTLTQVGGSLGTGASWKWYTDAGLTSLVNTTNSTDASYLVSPTSTTTYYVRAEGTSSPCTSNTAVQSVTITVNQSSVAPTSASATATTICNGTSVTLTQNGGSLGTGANWKWYTDNTFTTLVNTNSSSDAAYVVSPTSTTTYYVRAEGTNSPCTSNTASQSVTVTVNTASVAPTAAFSTAAYVCGTNGSQSITLTQSGGSLGTGATWHWYSDAGFTAAVGTSSASDATLVTTVSSTTTYYVRAEGGTAPCAANTASANTTVTYTATNTWIGQTTDWNNSANWSCGTVPNTSAIDAVIPGNVANMPKLTTNTSVHNLNIQTGGTVDLNGMTLSMYGAFSGTGAGGLKGNTTSIVNIKSAAGSMRFASGSELLFKLTLDSNKSVSLASPLNITWSQGVVTVNSGATLTTNGNLTLQSQATFSARVAPSAGSITGAVTVERYIPWKSQRAWELLSVPTMSSQSIHDAWQEGQAATVNGVPGYGTNINSSSSASTAQGFDYLTMNFATIQNWNIAAGSGAWAPMTTTLGGIQTTAGYLLWVNGDRSVAPSSNNIGATTLRTRGTLYQGTQTPFGVAANKYVVVGNVYASPVDFTLLNRAGTIPNAFYVWDPRLAGTSGLGAYQTFSASNGWVATPGGGSYGATPYSMIQSGQAFMVFGGASGGTFTFTEAAKTTLGKNVFRREGSISRLKTTLYGQGNTEPIDAATVVFDNNYSKAVDINDITKATNPAENFAVSTSNTNLAIEARPDATAGDRIQFAMSNMKQQDYRLDVSAELLSSNGQQAYLEDSYLHTSTALNMTGNTSVSFAVDNNPMSAAATRFAVVFGKSAMPKATEASHIAISPNPVTGSMMNVQFTNKAAGTYRISLTNVAGQNLYTTTVNHAGGSNTQLVKLPRAFAQGVYNMQVVTPEGKAENIRVVVSQ